MTLSRCNNNTLCIFFAGGALFLIATLAVAVHLASFFLPPTLLPPSSACLSLLHDSIFFSTTAAEGGEQIFWSYSPSQSQPTCPFKKLTPSDASHLLVGSRVMVAGDSQARLLLLSLLSLLLPPSRLHPIRADLLLRRHDDHQITAPAAQLDFVWAPFVPNITATLKGLRSPETPDVIVVGDGLWHMLHQTNPSRYALALVSLRSSALSLLAAAARPPIMFWLGMPVLVSGKLNREDKRAKMNDTMWNAYQAAVHKSKILRQAGGPFHLLDIGLLSRRCGSECADDGMHYHEAVYNAATQLMLNSLSINSDSHHHWSRL